MSTRLRVPLARAGAGSPGRCRPRPTRRSRPRPWSPAGRTGSRRRRPRASSRSTSRTASSGLTRSTPGIDADGLADTAARADEHRGDQLAGMEPGLADELAQGDVRRCDARGGAGRTIGWRERVGGSIGAEGHRRLRRGGGRGPGHGPRTRRATRRPVPGRRARSVTGLAGGRAARLRRRRPPGSRGPRSRAGPSARAANPRAADPLVTTSTSTGPSSRTAREPGPGWLRVPRPSGRRRPRGRPAPRAREGVERAASAMSTGRGGRWSPGARGSSAASAAPSAVAGDEDVADALPAASAAAVAGPTAAQRRVAGSRAGVARGRRGSARRRSRWSRRRTCRRHRGAAPSRPAGGPPARSRSPGRAPRRCPASARAASRGPACPAGRPTSARGAPRSATTRAAIRSTTLVPVAAVGRAADPADRRARDRGARRRHPVALRGRDHLQRPSVGPSPSPRSATGSRRRTGCRIARSVSTARRVAVSSSRATASRASPSSARTWTARAPWPGAAGHQLRRQDLVDPVRPSQSRQPGDGQDQRVGLAVVEPPEPRVDVAVERVEDEVGPLARARTPCAAGCPSRPATPAGSVASVLPRSRQTSASRGSSRTGYAAITRAGCSSVGTSLAEWTATSTDPSSSAASIPRTNAPSPHAVSGRAVVARGAQGDQLGVGTPVLRESVRDPARLDHRQRAAPGADPQRPGHASTATPPAAAGRYSPTTSPITSRTGSGSGRLVAPVRREARRGP